MAWSMIGNPTVKKGTKALAQHFASMTPVPQDRPMKPRLLKLLRSKIESGEFRTCEWASASCGGVEYRVNGKHTSTILADYDGEYEYYVVITRFECDQLEELAHLYSTFDSPTSVRCSNDITRIYAASDPDLVDLPSRLVSICVTGISFATWEEYSSMKRAEERAELMLRNKQFVIWMHRLYADDIDDVLRRGPVVAAIFKTYQKDRDAAFAFWVSVRDGEGEVGTPVRLANKMLLRASLGSSGGMNSEKTRMDRREMYVRLISAWNAYRRGIKTELRYYRSAKTPEAI